MSTLADELLQDFEDSDADQAEEDGEDDTAALMGLNGADVAMDDGDLVSSDEDEEGGDGGGRDGGDGDGDDAMGDADDEARSKGDKAGKALGLRSANSLVKTLDAILEKIRFYQAQPDETRNAHVGNVEEHPEYHLLTQANGLSTAIDSEVVHLHKWIRDRYSVRFPELETLVTNPLEYAKTAAVLGNGPLDADTMRRVPQSTDNALGVPLEAVLDRPTLMIVTTSAITSKGQAMGAAELEGVVAACQTMVRLEAAKRTLTDYVQSRMTLFAPNLTALIGSLTAAQLLNTAGGLTGLCKTPACNIAAWGSKKGAQASALATNVTARQQGFLYQAPVIRTIPSDLKKQAMRIVAAKVVLAARVDRIHSSPDGTAGAELRDQCLERLDKLQEKPLNKGAKALPAPDDKPSRKRGGRRARQAKAATAMTDLRKAQNRIAFGKEEKEVGYGTGDSTAGLGMIGAASDGRVRSLQVDQRTRAKLSAKNKGWGGLASVAGGGGGGGGGLTTSLRGAGAGSGAASGLDLRGRGLRASGVGTTVGTASSLAFTPVQGLELVDPSVRAELGRKRKAEEDRYFKGGTFTQIGGGGGGGSGSGAVNGSSGSSAGNGVFKKPALPPAKRVDTGATK